MSGVTTVTLTGFLSARIAEDDAWAMEAVFPQPWRFEASRVLAECEAKRRIVARHVPEPVTNDFGDDWLPDRCSRDHAPWPCADLRALASVYADHPDFREEWRP